MKVKLGEYIQEYSVRNKANEDIPVYSVTNTQGFCQDYFGKEVASKDKSTYKIVPRGYFAYNPSRINVGSVDWQRDEDQVIVSPLYNVFSVSPELNQQYLYYYLKSDFALHRIKAVATGSVRDNLKLEMLKNFPIRIPRVEEQEYIVQVLDKAKNIINLRRNELQKLDDLIKARFVELFGDQTTNPYGWQKASIGACCTLKSGTSLPADKENEGGAIPYVKVSDMNYPGNEQYITTSSRFVSEQTAGTGVFPVGTVVFPKRGGAIGTNKKRLTRIPICADLNVMGVTAGIRLTPQYLMAYFSNIDLGTLNNGSSVPQINNKDIAPLLICLPPMVLQQQFAEFVIQVDKSKLLSVCRLFHSWAPENRDQPKHVGVPQRKTKVLRGGRRQQ